MKQIKLTPQEMRLGELAGELMHELSEYQSNYVGDSILSPEEFLASDIAAQRAELAVAKFLKLKWTPHFNSPKHIPDVGFVQVRWCAEKTGRLVVRPRDDKFSVYVLVLGKAPLLYLMGWAYGTDVIEQGVEEDLGFLGKPAHFLTADKLRDIKELKK